MFVCLTLTLTLFVCFTMTLVMFVCFILTLTLFVCLTLTLTLTLTCLFVCLKLTLKMFFFDIDNDTDTYIVCLFETDIKNVCLFDIDNDTYIDIVCLFDTDSVYREVSHEGMKPYFKYLVRSPIGFPSNEGSVV